MTTNSSFKSCIVVLMMSSAPLFVLMTIMPSSVSAAGLVASPAPMWAINRADAIKRFKAADSNGDCIITESELLVHAISHIIDPTSKIMGYTFDNESVLQDIVKKAYHYMYNNMSANGTKHVGPADFVQNIGSWKCTPKVSRGRSLVGRSLGASCNNVCTHKLHCCGGSCTSNSCPGTAACTAGVSIVTSAITVASLGWGSPLIPLAVGTHPCEYIGGK